MFMCLLLRPPPLPCFLPVVFLGSYSSASLNSTLLDLLTPLDSSSPPNFLFYSNSDSDTIAASDALFFTTARSMPACSHHRQYTLAPGYQVACSQRSRIGRVAIYCATVFCLLVNNFLIPSKPASSIASDRVRYS